MPRMMANATAANLTASSGHHKPHAAGKQTPTAAKQHNPQHNPRGQVADGGQLSSRAARRGALHCLLATDPGALYLVPQASFVSGYPSSVKSRAVLPPVALCPSFAAGGCTDPACKLAHAHLAGSVRHVPHTRDPSWRVREDVPYAMFDASGRLADLAVGLPHNVSIADDAATVHLVDCLKTCVTDGCAGDTGDVQFTPRHCGHWLLKGTCGFGAACKFVHAAWPPSCIVDGVVERQRRADHTGGFEPTPLVKSVHSSPPSLALSARGNRGDHANDEVDATLSPGSRLTSELLESELPVVPPTGNNATALGASLSNQFRAPSEYSEARATVSTSSSPLSLPQHDHDTGASGSPRHAAALRHSPASRLTSTETTPHQRRPAATGTTRRWPFQHSPYSAQPLQ